MSMDSPTQTCRNIPSVWQLYGGDSGKVIILVNHMNWFKARYFESYIQEQQPSKKILRTKKRISETWQMLRAFQQIKSASIWLADLVVKLNQSDQMKYAQLKAKGGKSGRTSAGKVQIRAWEKCTYERPKKMKIHEYISYSS